VNTVVITNAHLLDPDADALSDTSWLELAGGRISGVGTGRPPKTRDARVIDAAGATVLPGLIDAHVHVLLGGGPGRAGTTGAWTAGYATVRALAAAERMLRRGFTTVRDVGGADHGMARAIDEGLAVGPRLFFGGKALSQTGGHGDPRSPTDESRPCCQSHPAMSRIADGADEVRRAARDEFRKGAAHLKLLLSGGVVSPCDEIRSVQYGDDELAAAVEEAGNHNRYVTAHAYHAKAINRALAAGVRCVEHGNLLDDTTITLLRRHDAYLVPTLVTYEQLATYRKELGLSDRSYRKIFEVRDAGLAALERAHKADVNLVFGTDLLGPAQAAQLQELTLRAQVQKPIEIIRSATTTAARLLGMAGRLGTLAVGALADLLVVDGNPLDDIAVLTAPERRLRHVIKAGAVVDVAG
jgi:imidazolonepropionase-like amidohydrolase